ncbi:hypothetical protein L1049_005478 [Liquidambar formosana]|uniref:RING-type domain-containing protein n=1 Tax=Liquidambar formosana TaxID=63359 RepID=A0AAP0RUD1_LIQFO
MCHRLRTGIKRGLQPVLGLRECKPANKKGLCRLLLLMSMLLMTEVVLSSPRAFQEARNNSRRDHGRTVVLDVDSEGQTSRFVSSGRNKRRRVPPNQTIINCDHYINLESNINSKPEKPQCVPAPPPPPKEPIFSCPICMGPLVEEMTTKCGHIFCKTCIKTAIASQTKCPTCRKRVTMKDIIRVYLPTTS